MFAAHVSPGLLGTQRVVLAENTPVAYPETTKTVLSKLYMSLVYPTATKCKEAELSHH